MCVASTAMCCGPEASECGACVKPAPLQFATGIRSFVIRDDQENQVFWVGKGDEPLVGEQPVVFQLRVGGLASAHCSVPSCRAKCKTFSLKMNRVKFSLQVNVFQLPEFIYFINPFQKPSYLSHFQDCALYLLVFIFQHVYNVCSGYTVDLGRGFCFSFGVILNLIIFCMPFLVSERRHREGEEAFS